MRVSRAILALAAALAVVAPGATTAAPPSISAYALYNSIGVNTHFSEGIERGNYAGVEKLLGDLGVKHVREGFNYNFDTSSIALQKKLHALYGISFTETVSTNQDAGLWAKYQVALGSAMEGFEGPNEVDYGTAWPGPLLRTMTAVSALAKSTHTPLEGPSLIHCDTQLYGDHSGLVDFLNMHWYFSGRPVTTSGWGGGTCGGSPKGGYGSFAYNVGVVRSAIANKSIPIRITETGYCSAMVQGCSPEYVNAAYTPQIFLFAMAHGIDRTYLYQLLSEDNQGLSHSFGLVSPNYAPKPMYYAMQGFIARVKDAPSTPRPVSYVIAGQTSTVNVQPISYANGDAGIILYDTRPIWDPNGKGSVQGGPISVSPAAVTLSGLAGHATVSTYDRTGKWTDSARPAGPVALNVSAAPTIVRYSGGGTIPSATAIPVPSATAAPSVAPTAAPTTSAAPSIAPIPAPSAAPSLAPVPAPTSPTASFLAGWFIVKTLNGFGPFGGPFGTYDACDALRAKNYSGTVYACALRLYQAPIGL